MTLVSTVSTVSRVCRESVEGVEPGLNEQVPSKIDNQAYLTSQVAHRLDNS